MQKKNQKGATRTSSWEARKNMITTLQKCIASSDLKDQLAQAMEDYFMSEEWQEDELRERYWTPLMGEIISSMEEASDSRIQWNY